MVAHRDLPDPELAGNRPDGTCLADRTSIVTTTSRAGSASVDRDRLQEHRLGRGGVAYAGMGARDFASPRRSDTASPDTALYTGQPGPAPPPEDGGIARGRGGFAPRAPPVPAPDFNVEGFSPPSALAHHQVPPSRRVARGLPGEDSGSRAVQPCRDR